MEKEILKKRRSSLLKKRNKVFVYSPTQEDLADRHDVSITGRNGFYHFQKNKLTVNPEDEELVGWMKKIAESSKNSYESRRMKKALNALGFTIGRSKTRRLMKEASIYGRYRKKYKVTTNSNHKKPLFEHVLNRQFKVDRPNQAYVSDITYLSTQEGWLYLAVVIDLFSRKVVGWSMSPRMKASLVCDALRMAIWQRKPKPGLGSVDISPGAYVPRLVPEESLHKKIDKSMG